MIKKCTTYVAIFAVMVSMVIMTDAKPELVYATSHPGHSACTNSEEYKSLQYRDVVKTELEMITNWKALVTKGGELSTGNYYLTGDVYLEETLVVRGAVRICLNGHSITFAEGNARFKNGSLIEVMSGASMTVCDCSGYGNIDGMGSLSVRGIQVYPKGIFTAHNMGIENFVFEGKGAAVYNEGTINLYNACIVMCEGIEGAVWNTGKINLFAEASIVSNKGTGTVIGVYNEGELNVYDKGQIGDHEGGKQAGAVYNKGLLRLYDNAIIFNNITQRAGGAIYNAAGTVEIYPHHLSGELNYELFSDNSTDIYNADGGKITAYNGKELLSRFNIVYAGNSGSGSVENNSGGENREEAPGEGNTEDTPSVDDKEDKPTSCSNKCSVCGGCTDPTCTVDSCNTACRLLGMKFWDVEKHAWYAESIKYVYHRKMMNGVGENLFDVNGKTNRAMIVTVLWRLEGEPVVSQRVNFNDVSDNQWFSKAVGWAASKNIVTGYSDGSFKPENNISREQFATILYRYATYKKYDVSSKVSTDISGFSDSSLVATYALPAMRWACGTGLMEGDGKQLTPLNTATRAQTAALLQRFCEEIAP